MYFTTIHRSNPPWFKTFFKQCTNLETIISGNPQEFARCTPFWSSIPILTMNNWGNFIFYDIANIVTEKINLEKIFK
jgi:hypothetical protein